MGRLPPTVGIATTASQRIEHPPATASACTHSLSRLRLLLAHLLCSSISTVHWRRSWWEWASIRSCSAHCSCCHSSGQQGILILVCLHVHKTLVLALQGA